MPITYSVSEDGHFIHATAGEPVTPDEFVEYEVAHATDDRVQAPVSELLEIEHGAMKHITREAASRVVQCRADLGRPPTLHRCAIVVSYGDAHGWDLATFYGGLVMLHAPKVVIVFGDVRTARIWLGIDQPPLDDDVGSGTP